MDFDAAPISRLYVTTSKAINYHNATPSFPIVFLKTILFDFTSMQDATENCYYRELVGSSLKKELNFIFLLEHGTKLIVLGEKMSPVAFDKFGVVGKKILN